MSETEFGERVRRIHAECREMPGLKLIARQASRFWHLGPDESEVLLDSLVRQGALLRTRDGHCAGTSGSCPLAPGAPPRWP